jgi:glycosyltransferase involved in cell wall biosynthesis
MKITFLLPGNSVKPVGGFKVVYEYANGLAKRGYSVYVVNTASLDKNVNIRSLFSFILRLFGYKGGFKPYKWIQCHKGVKVLWRLNLNEKYIPKSEYIVATAWQTAEWLKTYSIKKGKRCYLIHDYEHYMNAKNDLKERIEKTYKYGFINIITSPAGEIMLNKCNSNINFYIPNGIDNNIYKNNIDIVDPRRKLIGFPSRSEIFKGTADVIAALNIVKNKLLGYTIWCYGPYPVKNIPAWVKVYINPSNSKIAELLNNTAIFIVPSHYEGWGLPGAEAMACGAALITTDNIGMRDYAIDGITAIIVEPKNVNMMSNKILMLIKDAKMRMEIAEKGNLYVKKFSWDSSVNKLVSIFNGDN